MYSKEKTLVHQFRSQTERFINDLTSRRTEKYFVIDEFDSKNGIADLVVGTYLPYLNRKSIRKPVNRNWLSPLTRLNENTRFHMDDFVEKSGYSRKTAMLQLKEYSEAGFIEKTEDNTYIVRKGYSNILDTVIAIEAKLHDWKQALRQACRYRRFADYSFVLLDADRSAPALKNRSMFEDHNVGLIILKNRSFKIIVTPERRKMQFGHSYYRLNEEALTFFITNFLGSRQ